MTGYRRKEMLWSLLFVAPPVLGFLIFGLAPLLTSLGLSFMSWDMMSPAKFTGLDNFGKLAHDEKFYKSMYNTFYLLLGIPLGMVSAMALALMMNRPLKGVSLFRTIYYIPVISPIIAVSLLWQWLLNYDYGIINEFIWKIFGVQGPNWLGDPNWVKPSFLLMGLWGGVGGTMVLYLAGLQGISSSYYEAAEVDGAKRWHQFRYITLPLLSPIHFFVVVMGVIGTFQSFSQMYILAADGGPEYSGATIVYYIFQEAFKYFNMGFASSVAWVLGVIIFILTLIQFRFSKRWVYQD
ncbi:MULTISPECIES: sugar ABC transporter permease [unclassified Paenibacillus]|uniref:carbohydrate ABC transporter permease n=1 Tax=unclassified Paenibacillus TaxID=185978 RepID=UPI0009559FEC|nr:MULTISPECIES: sugar ABC transporter permease [unclassified Paenibacillus]ASS67960.1 sugar ABC transporter permease [Paenibacillus sp. RUD330]SIR42786.1 multiple sugar transport system permease protein [Paenibacillus sp. RU4X]SIR52863.1 multiple sugar transport system permease protein [Paenibacillus sp. RU4T]